MKITTKLLGIAFASTLIFTGCEELENLCDINEESISYTEDYTEKLNAAIYIYQQSDLALRDSTLKADGTATIDGAACTRTADSIVIDYGNGITGADGKLRTGSIRMAYSGDYMVAGSFAAIKLVNYTESDEAYMAEINLTNSTTNQSAPAISLDIVNLSADSLALTANMAATWSNGFETQDVQDDAFDLSGSAQLENTANSETFTGNITSPLYIETSCDYTFVGGMIDLTPSNTDLPFVSLDFIDGDCQNLFQATVDCDGNSLSFSYPIR